MKKIYVFFDGKCGICLKEINYYKKKDKNSCFEWIDVNHEKNKLDTYGISYTDSLKFLHVIDRDDRVVIGVEAFLIIWNEFKYWRAFSKIINFKPIKYIITMSYNIWAKRRYKKLKYKCDL